MMLRSYSIFLFSDDTVFGGVERAGPYIIGAFEGAHKQSGVGGMNAQSSIE